MSTIKDVAKMANVSVATVSRVLNNSDSVTDKTREKVLHAIQELNYQPNLLGRNLRRSETRMILILLPTISNTFYSKVVKGMEDTGHRNGYNVMICTTNSEKQREEIYLNILKNKLADGVIFLAPEIDAQELSKIGKSFPVVQCCEYKENADVPSVSIDNEAAAYHAVQYLISSGHRRIGMISSNSTFISTVHRENGYKKAIQEAGIEWNPNLIVYGNYGFRSGLNKTRQLLDMEDRPTAIFAISDMMAIGAIRAAQEKGLRVPDDVAVIGFDNVSFLSMIVPKLTTIAQPQYEMGAAAMDILLQRIKNETVQVQHIRMGYELIVRDST